ncbi:hypothetical protein J437_LFUL019341 [Ladona fulva]|uniref:Uncharacterized protein n=1 Tax=Ladona fulva TaxID=123851 RepID=A0A8K0KV12_LADFU|nr:hypothetical protein J437_LFUL019341 [Ladona fulva]
MLLCTLSRLVRELRHSRHTASTAAIAVKTPVKEACDYLFSEVIEADITAIPPEVDELTDEDGVDDDALALPLVSDVAGAAEIFVQEEE